MNRKERRAAKTEGTGSQHGLGSTAVAGQAGQIAGMFDTAMRFHQHGQLAEAEGISRQILVIDPNHLGSLHFLGAIAIETGRFAFAVECFGKALSVNDRIPEFHGNLGVAYQSLGEFAKSVASYRRSLTLKPDNAGIQNNLGCALNALRKFNDAVVHFKRALALSPNFIDAVNNLGNTLALQGNFPAAADAFEKALAINPADANLHGQMGYVLARQGKIADAIARFEQALALDPGNFPARKNIGAALIETHRLQEAIDHLRRALALRPDQAEVYFNLALALADNGAPAEAIASYQQALTLKPDYADASNNLGILFERTGDIEGAIACFERAISLRPNNLESHANLAMVCVATGHARRGLDNALRAFRIEETQKTKETLFKCLKRFGFDECGGEFQDLILRALSEPWGMPKELTPVAVNLLKRDLRLSESIGRAAKIWPARLLERELFGPNGFGSVCEKRLLIALLESAPIVDVEFEKFLTVARAAFLESATSMEFDGPVLSLCCALARQCFINEYVFDIAYGEMARVSTLRDSLVSSIQNGLVVPGHWPAIVAMYFPLHALPVTTQLAERSWPNAVRQLVLQQIVEPLEELDLRPTVRNLTPVQNEISKQVQKQYEENPYPRWVKTAPTGERLSYDVALRRRFAYSSFSGGGLRQEFDLLIAGCGTGQHAIDTAQRYPGARILAIDLSQASLCYAKRMTHRRGLKSIEYAQADILELASLGKSFDVIESVGVLHHLADPGAGWRVLISLLRPGGYMRIGLYSALARKNVVAARAYIAERGYSASADDIRRCRQDLIALGAETLAGSVARTMDFFSVSECRDLIFHVQEHQFTLMEIKTFLIEHDLQVTGIDVEPHIAQQYRVRFPEERTLTDLDCWNVFENENPRTFSGMYQFFIQKPASAVN